MAEKQNLFPWRPYGPLLILALPINWTMNIGNRFFNLPYVAGNGLHLESTCGADCPGQFLGIFWAVNDLILSQLEIGSARLSQRGK